MACLLILVQVAPVLGQHEISVEGKAFIRVGSGRWQNWYYGEATLAFVPDPHDPHCVDWGVVITVGDASFAWYVEDVKACGPLKIVKAQPHPAVDLDSDGVYDILEGPSEMRVLVFHRDCGLWVLALGPKVFFKA
jgi:hypothetical protein